MTKRRTASSPTLIGEENNNPHSSKRIHIHSLTQYRVGTAAWSLPSSCVSSFPASVNGNTHHLCRYSRCLNAVEINTSFYRHHSVKTYTKWRLMVPEKEDFLFSIKLYKGFTHEKKLKLRQQEQKELKTVMNDIQCGLGNKLGVVLIQLPPSLIYDYKLVNDFLSLFRCVHPTGAAVIEPRHKSWNGAEVEALLHRHSVTRVIADPAGQQVYDEDANTDSTTTSTSSPSVPPLVRYFRLHGSPVMYKSNYGAASLQSWTARMSANDSMQTWCIFDNTALGHATDNALKLKAILNIEAKSTG